MVKCFEEWSNHWKLSDSKRFAFLFRFDMVSCRCKSAVVFESIVLEWRDTISKLDFVSNDPKPNQSMQLHARRKIVRGIELQEKRTFAMSPYDSRNPSPFKS